MPLANDLLEQAYHLAKREPKRPRQASLRRAVSTAYYALFHMLLSQVTANWKQNHQRPLLARYFKHGNIFNASDKQKVECARFFKLNPQPGVDTDCMTHLQTVSLAFFQAYQQREIADYNIKKTWTRTEALTIIDTVDEAFKAWPKIRSHELAQAYLFSFFGDSKGR